MSSQTVTRPAETIVGDRAVITRYSFAERANHWVGALAYCYCLITGLAFWTPYLFWLTAIVGGGPTARFCHPWIGLLFTASLFVSFEQWQRDMRVDENDKAWAREIDHYIKNEDDKLPPQGRFNYGQKLYFWAMIVSTILLLISGIGLWYVDAIPWSWRYLRYTAILVHASVAMITIGLFLIHVYMSTLMEEGSFASMVHGTVTRAWAWTFHRNWYYEVTGKSRPRP
jgi:formate dehydrogenase subunit gamma